MDIFGKKKIAELSAALANSQAQATSSAKKAKTAMIVGGSTTGVAAAAAAVLHFGFGSGNRKIKEAKNNYASVKAERDELAENNTALKVDLDNAKTMFAQAIGAGYCIADADDETKRAAAVANLDKYTKKMYAADDEAFAKLKPDLKKGFEELMSACKKAEEAAKKTEENPSAEEVTGE